MFKKVFHFIKYNNLVVLIIAVIFLLGTGVFAQTEAGQALIGTKEINYKGTDNTLLLEADLDNLGMDYTIEKIEDDEDYYYVIYTYIDLIKQNNSWIYQMQEKSRKVSKNLKQDLGEYLAEELSEEYSARVKFLKTEQAKALANGEEKRIEVVEYNGLIGQTLELAGKIFPAYEPVKRREIPLPSLPPNLLAVNESDESLADDLTDIYNEYIDKMDPDRDDFLGVLDNCPNVYNPDQADSDDDGMGDACEQIIGGNKPVAETSETATSAKDVADDSGGVETKEEEPPAEDEPNDVVIDNQDNTDDSSDNSSTDSADDADSPDSSGPKSIIVPETDVEIIELPE
ncbi:MAG: hypothetical protein U9R06_02715 [Patescibacteria group bacterium]|nr:hypothetical protein [Patescibacteria group bacterium]